MVEKEERWDIYIKELVEGLVNITKYKLRIKWHATKTKLYDYKNKYRKIEILRLFLFDTKSTEWLDPFPKYIINKKL